MCWLAKGYFAKSSDPERLSENVCNYFLRNFYLQTYPVLYRFRKRTHVVYNKTIKAGIMYEKEKVMQEILPGIFHWITFHEGIEQDVHSYYIAATDPAVLIDPRIPAEGIQWFQTN